MSTKGPRRGHQRHSSTPSISLSALSLGPLATTSTMTSATRSTLSPYSSPEKRPASTRSQRSNGSFSSRKELPPLFWYMEAGEWLKAEERLRRHPREIKTWATLRTKSGGSDSTIMSAASTVSVGTSSASSSGTKRLALHHACFKLRSAGSTPPPRHPEEDPFVTVCRFILLLTRLYPEAAGERESRHGCLPLHLAAFASCASRKQPDNDIERPAVLSRRCASDATAATNMSAMNADESMSSAGTNTSSSRVSVAQNLQISARREEFAVKVLNALLDAYPKAVRVDSEGGRLPLHTACAGRATPRVVATLVTAYPAAARHRNKDGFLPLHLAAHWGVSHPNVAITLLRTYPDATVGRNRWERTPLEEALCMAGENGRPHQSALVRALRKHPSFWTIARPEMLLPRVATTSMAVDVDESLPSNDEDDVRVPGALLGDRFAHEEFGQEVALSAQAPVPPSSSGIMGRFAPGRRKGAVSPTSVPHTDVDLTFPLDVLVQKHKWRAVIDRIRLDPLEPEKELKVMTRGGFQASTGFTALHYACERSPPIEVVQSLIEAYPVACLTRCMPGGCLPLHVACTWNCSPGVIRALLSADQGGVAVKDELGNLPLHSACFSGADSATVDALLMTDPKAVLARNHQGSRPLDIVRRLRHDNRQLIINVLTKKKDELSGRHRRARSSGTLSEVAQEAAALNGQYGAPPKGYGDLGDLQEPGLEVELSYPQEQAANNSNKQELLWI